MSKKMDKLSTVHNYAAPVRRLAGLVAWNARWEAPVRAERAAEAGRLLLEASKILDQIEAEVLAD